MESGAENLMVDNAGKERGGPDGRYGDAVCLTRGPGVPFLGSLGYLEGGKLLGQGLGLLLYDSGLKRRLSRGPKSKSGCSRKKQVSV